MNLSNQSKSVISDIGESMSRMFAMKMTPLQIMILMDLRYMESTLPKGDALTANRLRAAINQIYNRHGQKPPSKQAFWSACNVLRDSRLVYFAPPKKGSSLRNITLTASGEALMQYPASVHPYRSFQKQDTANA